MCVFVCPMSQPTSETTFLNVWRYHGTDKGITLARVCPIVPVQAVPPFVVPNVPPALPRDAPALVPAFAFLVEAQIDPEEVPQPVRVENDDPVAQIGWLF